MYVYKICVLKKARFSNANDKDMSVIKRINYVLRKIIILTLCYEFYGFIFLTYMVYDKFHGKGLIGMMFRELFCMTECVVSALMIYLMIEHNDEHYLKVLRILNKCKLCYCFDDGEEKENEGDVLHRMKSHNIPTIDTKTVYADHTVPMEHKTYQTSVSSNVLEE